MTEAIDNIEKLLAEVAEKAAKGESISNEKLDVLKLLQPYYAILKKSRGKSSDDADDGEPTMDEMQERLRVVQETDDGGIAFAGGRRRTG